MEEDEIKMEMLKILHEKLRSPYSKRVIDYGNNPRNYGIIDKPDGYAKVTGPDGDTIEIFLHVEGGKISDIKFTADNCMTSRAASSAVTEMAKGKVLRDCLHITMSAILDHLMGMPEKDHHCALLASMTLHRALRNYAIQKKNNMRRK